MPNNSLKKRCSFVYILLFSSISCVNATASHDWTEEEVARNSFPFESYSLSTYRESDPFYTSTYFGRTHDDSINFFSSGVSSYQGTSTGPGPNGGYPGTPHGTYQTDYYNSTR